MPMLRTEPAVLNRTSARHGRFQQFTPVWPEVEARIRTDETFPPSWFGLLVIAGLPAQRAIWLRVRPPRSAGRATLTPEHMTKTEFATLHEQPGSQLPFHGDLLGRAEFPLSG